MERRTFKWKWVVRLFIVIALVALFAVFVPPCFEGAAPMGHSNADLNHLKTIWLASISYAKEHDGRFPEDWTHLDPDLVEPETFRFYRNRRKSGSLSNVHDWTDYIYIKGLTTSSSPWTVFAYSPRSHPRGPAGGVIYVNGMALRIYEENEWVEFMNALQTGNLEWLPRRWSDKVRTEDKEKTEGGE